MTIEQKARAYDEALACAKMYYKENKDYNAGFLPIIFPELAESEDERIRKGLIEMVSDMAGGWPFENHKITKKEAITYLEKQKELDKMIVVSPEVWDTAITDAYENGKKDGEKQKEPHYTKRNALFDKCVENCDPEVMKRVSDEVDEMLEKEQKPDTRDADDLQLLGFIYDLLNEIEWKDNWAMSKDECLRRLNNYRPQPKQEWSEEDEMILEGIINTLNRLGYVEFCKSSRDEDIEEERLYFKEIQCLKKLKSLKPSWKPSEEEMRTLDIVISDYRHACTKDSDKKAEILKSLFNQLKKL